MGEITSRINPGLYALLTALGAGAAGAFITSRSEIADAFGGVAIAISLVPPLCVVGIALQHGQMNAATGASLLFMTNFLAILFSGSLVFTMLGLGKPVVSSKQVQFRRRAFLLFVVSLLLVSIPLSLTGYQNIMSARENARVTTEVQRWLDGTTYQVDGVNVDDGVVTITVEGTGQMKPLQQLAGRLSAVLGRPVLMNLRTLQSQRVRSTFYCPSFTYDRTSLECEIVHPYG